jgi:hypothetical protein
MKYTLTINQKAVRELSLDLDIIDMAIYDVVRSMVSSSSARMDRIVKNGKKFTWVAYSKIIEEAPLVPIKTSDGIYRRIVKLEKIGLIERMLSTSGKSYIRLTETADALEFDHQVESGTEVPDKNPTPTGHIPDQPSDINPDNPITKYNPSTKIIKPSAAEAKGSYGARSAAFCSRVYEERTCLAMLPNSHDKLVSMFDKFGGQPPSKSELHAIIDGMIRDKASGRIRSLHPVIYAIRIIELMASMKSPDDPFDDIPTVQQQQGGTYA